MTARARSGRATFFRLASDEDVLDANSDPIATPDMADVLAQITGDPNLTWELLTAAELDYIERYYGENLPIDSLDGLEQTAISAFSSTCYIS